MEQLLADLQEIKDPHLLKFLPQARALSKFQFILAKFSQNSSTDQSLQK
jgi:hypothetical protein